MVDDQAVTLLAGLQHHHAGRWRRQPAKAKPFAQAQQRQRLLAQVQHLLAIEPQCAAGLVRQHFDHPHQGQRIDVPPDLDEQRGQDRQGQRHPDREARADADLGMDLHAAGQLADARLHHVHAHAASGQVAHFRAGGEAGQEHQLQAFVVGHARGRVGIDQALAHRAVADPVGIDAGAVVAHLDRDMVAFLLRGQPHVAAFGLAAGAPRIGRLDAVVDRVAHEVHQRVGERLDQVAVELGVRAADFQLHLLADLPRDVARELGETREHAADRLHARGHHRRLQARGGRVQRGDRAVQVVIAQARAQGLQAVARQHQLADQVDHRIEPAHVDADGGVGRFGGAAHGRRLRTRGRRALDDRFGRDRRRRRHGVDGAGNAAHAVQAVQQRFEVEIVQSLVRRCGCGCRCGSRCGGQRLRHRGRACAQRRQQLRGRRIRGRAAGYALQHVDQQVQRLLRGVERRGVQRRGTAARGVEPVLDRVADRHHGGEIQEAGAALDRVEAAKHGIEAVAVGGGALERDHLLAQLRQDFAGLDQEVGADVAGGVEGGVHA